MHEIKSEWDISCAMMGTKGAKGEGSRISYIIGA